MRRRRSSGWRSGSTSRWSRAAANGADGSRISWRVAGRAEGLGAKPFYISWDDPAMRPGLLSAPHAVEVRGISSVEVGCSAEDLRGRVADALPVRPLGDGDDLRAIVIATSNGEIRLTGDS